MPRQRFLLRAGLAYQLFEAASDACQLGMEPVGSGQERVSEALRQCYQLRARRAFEAARKEGWSIADITRAQHGWR